VSVSFNIALWKATEKQILRSEIYENWIYDFKSDVRKTYEDIKTIDDRQMFEKDDDVGVVFQDMLDLIKKLDDRVHEEETEN
jgi:hypothetical protein